VEHIKRRRWKDYNNANNVCCWRYVHQ